MDFQNKILKNDFQSGYFGLLSLIFFNLLIFLHKPFNIGPDRAIHDPAVNRIIDPTYLTNDWFVNAISDSGVHFFYGKLISLHAYIGIDRFIWEDILYILSLQILIFSFFKITKTLNRNIFLVLILFLVHALAFILIPPQFGYGEFFPIDYGLAPRSLSIPFTFLSISFMLRGSYLWAAFYVGLSTLLHPSNGILSFMLIFLIRIFLVINEFLKFNSLKSISEILKFFIIYILSGGFFAFLIALNSIGNSAMDINEFSWAWIYLRAPYLDILDQGLRTYALWIAHFLMLIFFIYKFMKTNNRSRHQLILILISIISIVFFAIFYISFYFFPSKTIFSLYSFRLIYLFFFSIHLMSALYVLKKYSNFLNYISFQKKFFLDVSVKTISVLLIAINIYIISDFENLKDSFLKFGSNKLEITSDVHEKLYNLNETVMMDPKLVFSSNFYISSFVSFKNFGFTETSMKEWLKRLNLMCSNSISKEYINQLNKGKFSNSEISWENCFNNKSEQELKEIMSDYRINYLLIKNSDDRFSNIEVVSKNETFKLLRINNFKLQG